MTKQVHLALSLGLSSVIPPLLFCDVHGKLWGDLYLYIFYVSQNSEILGMKTLEGIEDADVLEIFQRSTIDISNINTLK